ncbi:MAG: UDP-N-acetylglucosamine--N-acetylmuramyl-(pentapeptide) pyrophosphoryl-undecaprenol N-acetylglucosamine transferase [Verrucomicrobia bacterium]|nr:UDP-N-acetylglucosamine--N-acetylmuramyl-(pentapeptide) pyrophosphoryl-undecaprenol N-acetylglucosamine transferase [Verrucomicrobiota bacterium]
MSRSFTVKKTPAPPRPHTVIACGGTGGHLFPGIAVASELHRAGVQVTLVVSEKEVDALGLQGESRFDVVKLPAAGMGQRGRMHVVRGAWQSLRICLETFSRRPPTSVLSMGGFTSAAPLIAGRRHGARLFIHDSNAIPGRANRWLSWFTHNGFVAFEEAAVHLRSRQVILTGTPVRSGFLEPESATSARRSLGLDPDRPTLLVMGGSQGARAINDAFLEAIPALMGRFPQLQYIHLSGPGDFEGVQSAFKRLQVPGVVKGFSNQMETVLASATLAISRSGGSSLAEFAAMQLPCILIPYPTAADDHQMANALAFSRSGAAEVLPQSALGGGKLSEVVTRLLTDPTVLETMRSKLRPWRRADAASRIADAILGRVDRPVQSGFLRAAAL